MKLRIALTVAVFLTTSVQAREWPEVIPVPIEGIHIPIGFDDNDQITVVTTGTLKKTCQWENSPQVKVDNNGRTVTIKQIVHGYPSTCAETSIPYSRTIDIGMLPAGEYRLIDGVNHRELGRLPVKKATKAATYGPYADETMYALVQDAYIHPHGPGTDLTLTLEVRVPADCLRYKEAKVEYHPGVIVVMPLLEGEASCKGELRSQRHEIPLRNDLRGRQLIHVRSLWGRSLNKLVELGENDSQE